MKRSTALFAFLSRGGKTDGWIGAIDEVRIYDRALSSEEVAVLSKLDAK